MGKVSNLARMTVASAPGTGATIALGSPAAGHISFSASGIADGDVVTYAIQDGLNREIGTATYSATGPTLTGRTVLNSTNSNAAINASATAEVFITMAASDLNAKASLASPALTGTPTAPTASAGTNTTQIATTAFVTSAVAAAGGGGGSGSAATTSFTPSGGVAATNVQDAIVELDAEKIAAEDGFHDGVLTLTNNGQLALRLVDPTSDPDAREWRLGTKLNHFYIGAHDDAGNYKGSVFFVDSNTYVCNFDQRPKFGPHVPYDTGNLDMTGYAGLYEPHFSGAPTAPTAAPETSTTQLATTEFVQNAIEGLSGGGGPGSAATTSFTPSGGLSATNVQDALVELDSEKAALAHAHAIADVTNLQTTLNGKLNSTGGTLTGKLVLSASTTGAAPINAPHGTGPSAPVNGDIWTTTAGIYVRINNATIGPLVSTATIPAATTSANGLMASADKTKLNAVGSMANRAVTISTALPSGGADGDVWFKV